MKPYRRTVRPDQMIFMSGPFANPSADVRLPLPNGTVVTVTAAVLNQEYQWQQAAYAAQAYRDANGVLRGPTGRRRYTNRIRLVDVAHLVTQLANRYQLAS